MAAIAIAIFGAVYEIFSHGVWSGYMVYAFLFPLVLDAFPAAWLALRGRSLSARPVMQLHHAGVATLTVGSIIEGVLAIYGTTNRMTCLYWISGVLLITAALVVHLLTRRRRK